MALLRKRRDAETELMQELSQVLERDGAHSAVEICPDPGRLRQLSRGQISSAVMRDALLAHLGHCDRCVALMASFRKKRRYGTTSLLSAAAAILIVGLLWTWNGWRGHVQQSHEVAMVDLRPLEPTRGNEHPEKLAATIHRNVSRLHVILPVGSADGNYEVGVFRTEGQASPIVHIAGSTKITDHSLDLTLPGQFASLAPGRYLLGIRDGGAEWAYYSLVVE